MFPPGLTRTPGQSPVVLNVGVASERLKIIRQRPISALMKDPAVAVPYLVLWAAMMRALLVRARVLPMTCSRCARPFERRDLGESVCACEGD